MPNAPATLAAPSPRARLAESVQVCFLGLWLGTLIMIGFAAPATFITLRGLDPALPQYAQFEGPHYLIAGGRVVRKLFAICDTLQIVSGIAVVTSFALIAASPAALRKLATLRGILLAGLIVLLCYRFFLLDPGLTQTLDGYWQAAAAGDNPRAAELRARYESGHRFESRLFGVTAVLVLGLLITALLSTWRGHPACAVE